MLVKVVGWALHTRAGARGCESVDVIVAMVALHCHHNFGGQQEMGVIQNTCGEA